jgi:hypothetical protein
VEEIIAGAGGGEDSTTSCFQTRAEIFVHLFHGSLQWRIMWAQTRPHSTQSLKQFCVVFLAFFIDDGL